MPSAAPAGWDITKYADEPSVYRLHARPTSWGKGKKDQIAIYGESHRGPMGIYTSDQYWDVYFFLYCKGRTAKMPTDKVNAGDRIIAMAEELYRIIQNSEHALIANFRTGMDPEQPWDNSDVYGKTSGKHISAKQNARMVVRVGIIVYQAFNRT